MSPTVQFIRAGRVVTESRPDTGTTLADLAAMTAGQRRTWHHQHGSARDPQEAPDNAVNFDEALSEALEAQGLKIEDLSDVENEGLWVEYASGDRSWGRTVEIAAETLRGE